MDVYNVTEVKVYIFAFVSLINAAIPLVFLIKSFREITLGKRIFIFRIIWFWVLCNFERQEFTSLR